jgi:O-acetyl-ADP-ribose deacetylase
VLPAQPRGSRRAGARSIAFSAIATGIYRFPPQQAARIAVTSNRSTPTSVEQVRLVGYDEPTGDLLRAGLEK